MSMVRRSKVSALMVKSAWEAPTKQELKDFGAKAGVYSIGLGIGTSLGYAANQLALPKIMKSLGPKERAILAGGIGVAAGLAAAAGTKKVYEGVKGGEGR